MNDLKTVLTFIVQEGLLLGAMFFIISLMVALLQQSFGQRLNKALNRGSLGSGSMVAATAGAVTPFCSCSTVPVLAGMLQARVRFGVCFTFLIASPVINEGVLLVLVREYSMTMAVSFLIIAFALSVASGLVIDRLGMAQYVRVTAAEPDLLDAIHVQSGRSTVIPFRTKLRFAMAASWNELKASAPYLFVGVVIGGLIYGYIPDTAIADLQHSFPGIELILIMAIVGVPFYVNAAMVVPIALALMTKGVSIGPIAAFLVSAAGTSIPEMIMLTKLFKAPLVISHVVVIVVAATVIGLALEWLQLF